MEKANLNTILERWRAEAFAWAEGPLLFSWALDFATHPGIDRNVGQATLRLFSTQAGGVESFFVLDPSESFGVLKGTQQANDNDVLGCFLNAGFKLSDCHANFAVRLAARWKVSDVDDCDWHLGCGLYDESYAASEPDDWFGFQLLESDANGGLNVRFGKDGSHGGATNVLTLADDVYARTLMEYKPDHGGDLDTGQLSYWADSNSGHAQSTTVRTEGKFPDDVILLPFWQHQNGAAAAQTHSLDYFYGWVYRPDYVQGTG